MKVEVGSRWRPPGSARPGAQRGRRGPAKWIAVKAVVGDMVRVQAIRADGSLREATELWAISYLLQTYEPAPDTPPPSDAARNARTETGEDRCHRCGEPLVTGPWGFTDCPACNPNPARE